ncbi:MAG: hypothetical protein ACOXZ0_08330 [Eubacteriales bacterium]|jgi:hypothetical protein
MSTHFVTVSRFDVYEIISVTGVYHTAEEAEQAIKERSELYETMFEQIIEVDNEEDEQ